MAEEELRRTQELLWEERTKWEQEREALNKVRTIGW